MKKTTEGIVLLMFEKYSRDISMFSDAFLENSIVNRMTSGNSEKPGEYMQKLADDPDEFVLLSESLSNSYSAFFRSPLTFHMLSQFVLPKIINEKIKKQENEIRIWSAGCASGQEAYSLAMISEDLLAKSNDTFSYHIFATDNDKAEIASARRGEYDFESVKNLPYKFIDNYMVNEGDTYAIKDSIKKKVEFSEYDLLDGLSSFPPDSIFGDFDLVMCSNVLLYYKPEFQKLILGKFIRSVSPGGFFATGEAEISIVNTERGFRNYMSPAALFVKG